ncbi:MAG: peroxide stress protein YaaA [Acidimicrobiia bacterium]|nr:peroxide stress protein YaaA [Acidimicrobiia bacterium]
MLIVLSPAKSLDYESKLPFKRSTTPRFLDESEHLVKVMATKSPDEIGRLMDLSSDLADLNWHRFQDWDRSMDPKEARPAVLAFKGDTYLGLDVSQWSTRDFTHAQKNLRILSGLHGVLRPLDRIHPYRLEMGTKLATEAGKNLYEFWGDSITETIAAELEGHSPKVLVNCASKEYFKAVHPKQLDATVVTPQFLDLNNGGYKTIGFFAKRARGAMASWLIRSRAKSLKSVTKFEGLGYRYSEDRSTRSTPVFLRDH